MIARVHRDLSFASKRTHGVPVPSIIHNVLPMALRGKAVLVIEDELMIAWMLEAMLSDLGFEQVIISASGEEALELALGAPLGLVISDINLGPSGIDGIDASAMICGDRKLPVIFISGYAGPESLQRIKARIAQSRVLRKPVNSGELFTAIVAITESLTEH